MRTFVAMIEVARRKANKVINHGLIELYWNIGHYISDKMKQDGWGNNTLRVCQLFYKRQSLIQRGGASQNLWRMK